MGARRHGFPLASSASPSRETQTSSSQPQTPPSLVLVMVLDLGGRENTYKLVPAMGLEGVWQSVSPAGLQSQEEGGQAIGTATYTRRGSGKSWF